MTKITRRQIVGSGLAMAALSGLPARAQAGPVRIAYIDPLSGFMAPVGDSGLAHLQFEAERINAAGGRDHHPKSGCAVLCGGGVKGGVVVGATNATGEEVVERPVGVPDLFVTISQLLGLDPRETWEAPSGRPIQAVDGGKVENELIQQIDRGVRTGHFNELSEYGGINDRTSGWQGGIGGAHRA